MNPLLILYPLNGLLMIAFAVGLGILLNRKFRLGGRLWLIGAATFTLSQVLHVPFNAGLTLLFQRGLLPGPPQSLALIFNAVVLGLSAGLFEEVARWITYRFFARDARSWRTGLMLGAGHGGIEAIITGALVLLTFAQMLALQGSDLSALIPPEQLGGVQEQVARYWSTPWYLSLVGALERLLVLPNHLAFSLLVLQAFTRRNPAWLGLAILLHALLDALAVFVAGTWGPYYAEIPLFFFTLLSLWIIFALRRPEPEPEPQPAAPPVQTTLLEPDEKTLDLDQTRYQ